MHLKNRWKLQLQKAKKPILKKREKMRILKRYNIQFISPPKNKNTTK